MSVVSLLSSENTSNASLILRAWEVGSPLWSSWSWLGGSVSVGNLLCLPSLPQGASVWNDVIFGGGGGGWGGRRATFHRGGSCSHITQVASDGLRRWTVLVVSPRSQCAISLTLRNSVDSAWVLLGQHRMLSVYLCEIVSQLKDTWIPGQRWLKITLTKRIFARGRDRSFLILVWHVSGPVRLPFWVDT